MNDSPQAPFGGYPHVDSLGGGPETPDVPRRRFRGFPSGGEYTPLVKSVAKPAFVLAVCARLMVPASLLLSDSVCVERRPEHRCRGSSDLSSAARRRPARRAGSRSRPDVYYCSVGSNTERRAHPAVGSSLLLVVRERRLAPLRSMLMLGVEKRQPSPEFALA